jgi:CubicO group peptidase (beta-lactamase class C family)
VLVHPVLTITLDLLISTIGLAAGPPPLTWDTLDAHMKSQVDQGFSGVVLGVRNGQIAFHRAYGMANREKHIPMRQDTILAIGSTPIDFTKAGILLLAQRGKLKLTDSIAKFLDKVPQDKQAITIQHLMTGRSGLHNFHDVPSDRDVDHSWIDRDEAIRRILSKKLLFQPGEGRRHSHSAFGLLAAIIEIVSGKSYQEFTREQLFKPAGMTDTRFFGESYPEERMAVGYGRFNDCKFNAPPFWGKTSWLVMGSGGQVSTAMDMWRWTQAVYGGKLLSAESIKHYGRPDDVLAGGDRYGFNIIYTGGPRSFMVMMTNSGSPATRARLDKLSDDLVALISNRKPPQFGLGVAIEVDDNRTKITRLSPDGPAARQGLRVGDLLLKAGGKSLGDEPRMVLDALLQKAEPIEFEIERDGKRLTVTVTPTPLKSK